MAETGVTYSGPLFSADLSRLGSELERDLATDLAEAALGLVRDELRPGRGVATGAFEAGLRIGGEGGARVVVPPDPGVAAWLEGVSSRNARSRFKGYRVFSKARAALERRARDVASRSVGTYVRKLS